MLSRGVIPKALASSPRPLVSRDQAAGVVTSWAVRGSSWPAAMAAWQGTRLVTTTHSHLSSAAASAVRAWYVGQLAAALIAALSGDGMPDLKAALAEAIGATDRVHAAGCTGQDRNAMGPNATVALVRRQGDRLDWLVLGDSRLLLDTGQGIAEYCDRGVKTIEPGLRKRIFDQLRTGNGYDDPAHRQTLAAIVESERRLRNTPGGYWIAGADPAAASHSLTGSCRIGAEAGEVRRVALLSDGAERAVTLFGLYPSWAALLDTLATDGPAACIAAVRAAEAADPDGRHYPRTKLSDDASALICDLVRTAGPGS